MPAAPAGIPTASRRAGWAAPSVAEPACAGVHALPCPTMPACKHPQRRQPATAPAWGATTHLGHGGRILCRQAIVDARPPGAVGGHPAGPAAVANQHQHNAAVRVLQQERLEVVAAQPRPRRGKQAGVHLRAQRAQREKRRETLAPAPRRGRLLRARRLQRLEGGVASPPAAQQHALVTSCRSQVTGAECMGSQARAPPSAAASHRRRVEQAAVAAALPVARVVAEDAHQRPLPAAHAAASRPRARRQHVQAPRRRLPRPLALLAFLPSLLLSRRRRCRWLDASGRGASSPACWRCPQIFQVNKVRPCLGCCSPAQRVLAGMLGAGFVAFPAAAASAVAAAVSRGEHAHDAGAGMQPEVGAHVASARQPAALQQRGAVQAAGGGDDDGRLAAAREEDGENARGWGLGLGSPQF